MNSDGGSLVLLRPLHNVVAIFLRAAYGKYDVGHDADFI
jgi:hypothetical protein